MDRVWQVGQVCRMCVTCIAKWVTCVKCVASGSGASQVGQVCCKSKCVWVRCVASRASGSNRLIIPTPKQVCQVCQHTCNQLLVPVCTRTEALAGRSRKFGVRRGGRILIRNMKSCSLCYEQEIPAPLTTASSGYKVTCMATYPSTAHARYSLRRT